MEDAEREAIALTPAASRDDAYWATVCDLTITKALLAPLRAARLERIGFIELEAEEVALRHALRQDVFRYAQQLAQGRPVRARPVRRPDLAAVLMSTVDVRLR